MQPKFNVGFRLEWGITDKNEQSLTDECMFISTQTW